MNQTIISVSQFISIFNDAINAAFPEVVVEGEVSGFKINQGKWIFFDIKDLESSVGCFMPIFSLKLPLEDGMKVRVTGTPKLTKWGKFSLTVRNVELAGEGELKRAMELLKIKLEKEGLFDNARKRELPRYPTRIGLITSGQSAAYADFIKILQTRWSPMTVVLADIQVQGVGAPDQIVNALDYFNSGAEQVDTIVLIRGGGSLEDLQAFSTEPVARAVAGSRTPIVVGVGHEIDVSLADFAADVRAATPTDAAQLAVPDRAEELRHINNIEQSMSRLFERNITNIAHRLGRSVEQISHLTSNLNHRIDTSRSRLLETFDKYHLSTRESISNNQRLLRSHNPVSILARGYSIVRQNDQIIKDSGAVKPEIDLMIQLAKGELRATPRHTR